MCSCNCHDNTSLYIPHWFVDLEWLQTPQREPTPVRPPTPPKIIEKKPSPPKFKEVVDDPYDRRLRKAKGDTCTGYNYNVADYINYGFHIYNYTYSTNGSKEIYCISSHG